MHHTDFRNSSTSWTHELQMRVDRYNNGLTFNWHTFNKNKTWQELISERSLTTFVTLFKFNLTYKKHGLIFVPAGESSASLSPHRVSPALPSTSCLVSFRCAAGREEESRCFSVCLLTSTLKRWGYHLGLSWGSVSILCSEDLPLPPVPQPSFASLPCLVIESQPGKGPSDWAYFQNAFTLNYLKSFTLHVRFLKKQVKIRNTP